MNKRTIRHIVAYICVLTMVFSPIQGFNATSIKANSTLTIIKNKSPEKVALVNEIKNAEYNFALLKEATVSELTIGNDGTSKLGVITDGNFPDAEVTKENGNIIQIGKDTPNPKWVQVDLGKAYDSRAINRVAVEYKTVSTSPKDEYRIQFSKDGITYVDVAVVKAPNANAGKDTYLDTIALSQEQLESIPYTKYVRVWAQIVGNNTYGMQVMGIAVLTDGVTKVSEVDALKQDLPDDPANLTVTSSDYGQLEYVFEGATGHDDYTYKAYVDGISQGEVTPGIEYVITGLTAGDHTVKIVSIRDAATSEGLVRTVPVKDVLSLVNTDRNIALNKVAIGSSSRPDDNGTACTPVRLTDGKTDEGVAANLYRWVASEDQVYAIIDLGKWYRPNIIEKAVLLQKSDRAAKNYTVDYSLDGTNFTTVAKYDDVTPGLHYTDINEEEYELDAFRYVRFSLSGRRGGNYGIQVVELALITKEDADLTEVPMDMLDDATNLTVTSSDYGNLEYKFEKAENDDGYEYRAFLNSVPQGIVIPDTEYTMSDLDPGKYTIKIVATKGEKTSAGIEKSVNVKDIKPLMTSDRNFAIGKSVDVSSIREEGGVPDVPANLTDGDLKSLFRFVSADTKADVVIDLGNYYRTDILERIAILFSAGRGTKNYTVEYSMDGATYEKVAESRNRSKDLQYTTINATECELKAVKYVKVSLSDPVATQGFQLYEMGLILDENADLTPVEITVPNDAEAINVEVKGYNTVDVTVTAAAGQEEAGYVYNVYMDAKKVVLENVAAGTYTLNNVPAGVHTFTVKSVLNNVPSSGIESAEVEVQDSYIYTVEYYGDSKDIAGKILLDTIEKGEVTYNNYARFKGVKTDASSIQDAVNVPKNVLDGGVEYPADETHPESYIADKTRWSSLAGIDDTWFLVDLGTTYTINVIDIVWQTASAKDYTISVSTDGIKYTEVADLYARAGAARYDGIELRDAVDARFVRINGISRSGAYGYSIWGLGIYGDDEEETYTVTIDGKSEIFGAGEDLTLSDATYGYYDATAKAMYAPNSTITVTSDMTLTSVDNTKFSIVTRDAAGLRYDGTPGLRFQTTLTSDIAELLESEIIAEGTLITAGDIYQNTNALTLNSEYTLNIPNTPVNEGDNKWYNKQPGVYCGSIVNIVSGNLVRGFVARAYVTIKYTNADPVTFYSDVTKTPKSVRDIAQAIIDHSYDGIPDEFHKVIDDYAAAK